MQSTLSPLLLPPSRCRILIFIIVSWHSGKTKQSVTSFFIIIIIITGQRYSVLIAGVFLSFVTHSWCLDLEGGAEEGVARGVMSSFLKSSLVSLDLKRHVWLTHTYKDTYIVTHTHTHNVLILTEQQLCGLPPHGHQEPEGWSNSQLHEETNILVSDCRGHCSTQRFSAIFPVLEFLYHSETSSL